MKLKSIIKALPIWATAITVKGIKKIKSFIFSFDANAARREAERMKKKRNGKKFMIVPSSSGAMIVGKKDLKHLRVNGKRVNLKALQKLKINKNL